MRGKKTSKKAHKIQRRKNTKQKITLQNKQNHAKKSKGISDISMSKN